MDSINSSNIPNGKQINDYVKLSEELLEVDSLKALKYAQKAYQLADSFSDSEGKMKATLSIAWAYYVMDKYADGLYYALEVSNFIEGKRENAHYASLLTLLGHIYRKTGNFDFSLEYYVDALKVYDNLQMDYDIAFIYRFISIVYSHMRSFDDALKYAYQALGMFNKLNNEQRTATVMLTLGDIYKELNDEENGILYNSKALEIYKKYKNKTGIAYCYINLGNIYCHHGDVEKAEHNYRSALDICKEVDDTFGIVHIHYYIANLYIKMNQCDEAERHIDMGLKLANTLNSQYLLADFYKLYSDFYAKKLDFKKAFEYYALYSEEKEKMTSKKYKEIIDQIQTEYDLYKKGKEVELYRLKAIELKKANEDLDEAYKKIKEQNIELQKMTVRLEELSKMDELTELHNRRGIKEILMQLEENVQKVVPYSLILCDIDNFKTINDQYGHQFGDYVLKTVAEIFKKQFFSLGYVARWGGEEFLFVTKNESIDSIHTANEIRKIVESTLISNEEFKINITMTFGVLLNVNKSFEESMPEVDQALYYGKNNGKNCVVIKDISNNKIFEIIRD